MPAHTRARRPTLAPAAALCLSALAGIPPLGHAQPTPPVRLSVATDGTQANGASVLLAVSRDGRTVLFRSSASNLVAGDTNGADAQDLFVRDRDTDGDRILDEPGAVRTVRVTEGLAGQQSTGDVADVTLSADGRYVLFTTAAPLVDGDTNGATDVVLRDRDADGDGIFDEPGAIGLARVSTGSADIQADGPSGQGSMTPDARYVLFSSRAPNLPAVESGRGFLNWYRKDRLTGLVTLANVLPEDPLFYAYGGVGVISPDGRFAMIIDPQTGTGVLRDFESGAGTSAIVLPAPPAAASAAGAVTAPMTFHGYSLLGFSPDSRFLYTESVTYTVETGYRRGFIGEIDVQGHQPRRSFRGVSGTRVDDGGHAALFFPLDHHPTCASPYDLGLARYDQATGRLTRLVAGPVTLASASAGARRILFTAPDCFASGSPLETYLLDTDYGEPLLLERWIVPGPMDAAGTMTTFTSADDTLLGAGGDTNGATDVFAVDLLSRLDRDADGLDDRWEAAMDLSLASGTGADGPDGDPDADGVSNRQEQAAGSHPRGTVRQFLAEGADNAFFRTRLAIANPGSVAATAVVRFDADDGTSQTANVRVPAGGRRTLWVDEVRHGARGSFAAVVESSAPLVSERTMSWGAGDYGAHAERAASAPSTTWFLAEGATGGFALFYLLQNPGDAAATATVRYLRPAPLPSIDRTYLLPARSRTTLPVDLQAPELASTDVSAAITADAPILVERAMYRSVPGQPFAAGAASAGVTAASTTWFLAEGATGDFFDLFLLLANPNPSVADVEIAYLLADGTVLTKTYAVDALSRRTIWVDGEDFPGLGRALESADVSSRITVTNGVPIVVERSMWFPGPRITPAFWTEAHNSPGATGTATRWLLADGEAGQPRGVQTFVLIANTSPTPARVRVSVRRDAPTRDPRYLFGVPGPSVTLDLPAHSRTTVAMDGLPDLAGTQFGVLVTSIGPGPLAELVVERAMYWHAGAEVWAAGTNLLATPLP